MRRLVLKLLICGITLQMAVFSKCSASEARISSVLSDQFKSMVEVREKRSTDPWDNSDMKVDKSFSMKKNFEITGFSEEEKQNLVHIHNAYRSLVRKPLAADMLEVSWDDEIAAFAQEWANKCTALHRDNRDLSPWVNMGENLYWIYSSQYHEARAVKWWWDEIADYNFHTQKCTPGAVCGHYVTLAWAKSAKIGCGIARCPILEDLSHIKRASYYFVCNYSGRFVSGIQPYMGTDLPCSNCHRTGFPKCRYNLCVSQDMIDNNIGYNGSTEITGLVRSETRSDPKTVSVPTTTVTEKDSTPSPTTLKPTTPTTTVTPSPTTLKPTTPTTTVTPSPTTLKPTTKPVEDGTASGKRYRCPARKRCPELYTCYRTKTVSRRDCRKKFRCPKWCYRKE